MKSSIAEIATELEDMRNYVGTSNGFAVMYTGRARQMKNVATLNLQTLSLQFWMEWNDLWRWFQWPWIHTQLPGSEIFNPHPQPCILFLSTSTLNPSLEKHNSANFLNPNGERHGIHWRTLQPSTCKIKSSTLLKTSKDRRRFNRVSFRFYPRIVRKRQAFEVGAALTTNG